MGQMAPLHIWELVLGPVGLLLIWGAVGPLLIWEAVGLLLIWGAVDPLLIWGAVDPLLIWGAAAGDRPRTQVTIPVVSTHPTIIGELPPPTRNNNIYKSIMTKRKSLWHFFCRNLYLKDL